jgi:hypothetical protein
VSISSVMFDQPSNLKLKINFEFFFDIARYIALNYFFKTW